MARIRSIKPEFFTSEIVASLPISTRLTFIGLWTHVDDNGVTIDNPKLITAALWPLEDDPREALARTSGDLASLSTAGLIQRYEVSGRRYVYVSGWDEHQRVSHPAKPRYPRPDDPAATPVTSANPTLAKPSGDPPETLARLPEILAPEQGAGSKEQGARSRDKPRMRGSASTADAEFDEFWSTYPRREAKGAARKAWDKAITRAEPTAILTGAARYRDQPGRDPRYTAHPATWLNADRWTDEQQPALAGVNGHRPFTNPTDEDAYGGTL